MLVALFVCVALLLIGLAVPLVRRSVPPNGWYGLRVAATFADEWVWYEANARSGRDLLLVGGVQLVAAIALLPVPADVYAIANVAILLAGVVGYAIAGVRRANRLLAQRQRG